jgi:2-C-methyl-D-erythritol 4-phosphate cytidylyltransferase
VSSAAPVACYALIPAAGVGQRAGTAIPKQYALLAGRTVLQRTLDVFASIPEIRATLVILSPQDEWFERLLPQKTGARQWISRSGGDTRAATVRSGLQALLELGATAQDWVLVHDAARCLIRPEWVQRLMTVCVDDAVGGILAMPVADTLKSSRNGRSLNTVDRSDKWVAQTPQMFRIGMLLQALEASGVLVTDEASAIEAAGFAPLLVQGDVRNLKITWPQDFELAQSWLAPSEIQQPVSGDDVSIGDQS